MVKVPCITRLEPMKLPPSEKYEAFCPIPGQIVTVFPPLLGNIVLHLTASIFILPEDVMLPVTILFCGSVEFTKGTKAKPGVFEIKL